MKTVKMKKIGFRTFVILCFLVVSALWTIYYLVPMYRRHQFNSRLIKLSKSIEAAKRLEQNRQAVLEQERKKVKVGHLHVRELLPIVLQPSLAYNETEDLFYKYLEQKQVICDDDIRHGNQHDGGWNVCLSPPFQMKKPCLVYSFGIGNDWRFEDDMAQYYGCEIMAFDPSLGLEAYDRNNLTHFSPLGLAGKNYVTKNGWTMGTFKRHLMDHGHSEKIIDYLKFDIEYTEWEVLQNIVPDLGKVKQIGIEVHLTVPDLKIMPNISQKDFISKYQLLKKLEKVGFRKFNYRLNPFGDFRSNRTGLKRSRFYELHYLNFNFVRDWDYKIDPIEEAKVNETSQTERKRVTQNH